jgi:hypothetical protein
LIVVFTETCGQRLPSADDIKTPFFTRTVEPAYSLAGAVVGPHHLLQLLGHRRAAILLIKAGMDTRDVVAGFESERQA